MKYIELIVTESCNLACSYCCDHRKPFEAVPASAITALVTDIIRTESQPVHVGFHGGEPLLAFGAIKEACTDLWEKGTGNRIRFATMTNGTLLDDPMKDWFRARRDIFTLHLSLDGTPLMHNINRDNSYAMIDTAFFHQNWPRVPVRMTASPSTLGGLASGVRFLNRLGFKVVGGLARGVAWQGAHYDVYEREMAHLAAYHLAQPDLVPSAFFPCHVLYPPHAPDTDRQAYIWQPERGSFMPLDIVKAADDVALKEMAKAKAQTFRPLCGLCDCEAVCAAITHKPREKRTRDDCAFNRIAVRSFGNLLGAMLEAGDHYAFVRQASPELKDRMCVFARTHGGAQLGAA